MTTLLNQPPTASGGYGHLAWRAGGGARMDGMGPDPVDVQAVPATRPPPSRPAAAEALDRDLETAVRHTGQLRRGFYFVVLLVALTGQVTGADQTLHIPLLFALPAVAALELGGVVVLANADVRRRLGERALGSRLLSAAITAGAVAFNWLAHPNRLLGGFFAGMSLLGYLVWATHAENSRRDRLRARGALPPTTPAYEIIGHWLRHPWLTRRAKALAKADPNLGLYTSLAAAQEQVRAEHRRAAISAVLHRKIRAAVDPVTADIAVHVYDLDQIADRLADHADYESLTVLIATDLTPARLTAAPTAVRPRRRGLRQRRDVVSSRTDASAVEPAASPMPTAARGTNGACTGDRSPTLPSPTPPSPVETSTKTRPRQVMAFPEETSVVDPAASHGPRGHDSADAPMSDELTRGVEPVSAAATGTAQLHADTDTATSQDGTSLARSPISAAATTLTPTAEHAAAEPDPQPSDPSTAIPPPPGTGASSRPPTEPASAAGTSQEPSRGERPAGSQDGDLDTAEPNDEPVPQTAAAAVAYWYQRRPDLHPREIGKRIGRSERTVRRYWPPTTDP
ncbi:hypothetical protein GCM10009558_001370 [Virgisporangium aurantiacum]